MSDAADLGAREARRLIGARQLSPVELLDACIARIERLNPAVNAVTGTAFERARDEARAAEQAVVRGAALGPLHGLPLGVKDLNDTGGLLTTYGSPLFARHVPERDERLVARLRAAGAIVFCKTNTPVFGAGANTTNPVWGATRNPFDLARTCGGSSGGSAVALACSMMPIATGSDSGGSLRIPAAFCGVSAHRGTPGLVPTEKHAHGYTVNGVQGPMAREVGDLLPMLEAMAQPDCAVDPLSFPGSAGAWRPEPVDLAGLRVAVSEDLGASAVDDGLRALFRERVARFGDAFNRCEWAHPDFGEVRECYWILRSLEFLSRYGAMYREHGDALGENVVANVRAGAALGVEQIAWAMAEQTRIYRRVQAFFDDHDLLICPAVAVPPFDVTAPWCAAINGEPLVRYLDWLALTWILTTPGVPVTAIPCGLDATGAPFGLQVVGPAHADARVLGAAAALERRLADDPHTARPRPDLQALAAAV